MYGTPFRPVIVPGSPRFVASREGKCDYCGSQATHRLEMTFDEGGGDTFGATERVCRSCKNDVPTH